MSFTSDYLKALEEEKKKKKSSATTKPLVNNRNLGKLSYLPTNQTTPVFSTTEEEEDDIAPVKVTEQERSWFQKGAFEDGYQFGDISRTVMGTASDLQSNIAKGILGIGEGVVDSLAYVAGGIGGMLGADEWQSNLEKFIKKDLVNEDVIDKAAKEDILTKMLLGEKSVDEVSVFGEKTDSLVQSAGQLAGTVGLQAVGVPWFITSGVTSFGSQADSALKEGASFGEAGASALISAGAELLTEKLFGGSGLGEKGLINLEPLTKGISNKVVKALADFGIDMAAEGSEEVVSQVVSNLSTALYKEENLGDILLSEEAIDGYIESAIGGAVLGGGMNAVKVGSSIKSGKDYRTGFTENEQKVVDWVMDGRIYEAEQSGKKLSKKEKDEIYNSIVEEMDRGSISLETIEEALGGETYDQYKDTIDRENKALEEFAELYEGDELKQQVDDLLKRSERKKLAYQVRQEVSDLVKDDRLAESYRERARKGQKFEADLTQYDEKIRPTIQSAIESGVLNNQRGTHEFVEFVAKISADQGVPFEFLNNQKLKESGFAVEGVTMNGRYTGDKIEINVDSKKAVQTTVGHEITHVLEGSKLYENLQNTLFEYAKSRKSSDSKFENEYKERLYKTRQLYKQFEEYQGIEGFEKIKKEVVADLVGDYLFQDSNFVKHLSTKDRNVFQRIYDEVKHLLKLATAGSKEARELERVKKAFEAVYRDNGNQNADGSDSDVQYSLVEDKETIDFLENQEHLTVYKAMVMIDGKLYPPMASQNYVEEEYTTKKGEKKTRRVRKLKNPSVLGRWQQSDERPDLVTSFMPPSQKYPEGYGQFDLLKSNGKTTGGVAYNPYEHTSNIVLNDQFAEAYQRPELVTVEYQIPVSELTSGYKAQYAKDPVGLTDWKAGGVAQKLKNSHRDVYLTRWSKPVRVLSDAEVAQKYKEILDKEEGISVPWNVVTPSLRTELEKIGVPIDYSDIKAGSTIRNFEAAMRGDYDKKTSKKTRYSLTESFTDSNGTRFDNAVLLDTDFFDGTPPRRWGEKLRTMVYERASEDPFILPIVDENGNTTLLQFASPKDRVAKVGGANHRVLDELSSTSDNISKLAVVHVDEIVSVSEENSPYYTSENNHQWLDANGWLHRNANVINQKNGNIYNITVDIAKAADGRTILYATDGKIKKVGSVEVNSLKIKGSRQNSNFSDNVAQESGNVNGQYSLDEDTDQKLKDVGLNYDSDSDTVSYSLSSLEDTFDFNKSEVDYQASRLEYEDALAKAIAVDKENVTEEEQAKAKRYLDSLFLIHDMIAKDPNRLDYEAAVGKSAWVSNAEYGGSIDFSTLCAKRRLFTGTFDAIQNEMPDIVLNENDFLQIRNMLLEKNLESPCSMCYVEGSRAKHGVYVAKWLKEYKKTNPEWVPQIADFTSTTRLEQTRINHPEAYEKYVEAMNKLSQRKPKEASVRTDYKGEILRDFKDTSSVAEKNKNGGVRFNSFSDFEVIHALDCMQVITDMARVGLNGQAYTKVKEFAEAFGNTGLKINLSLVAKDVDENGKLIMDETNGMNYAEAMDIRNRYSENVGTVIVVFNEAQLKAALADSTIDYVLPFHRSQWKKSQYTMMGLPTNTKDFTNFQNDRITNPNTGRDVKLSKIKHISQYTNDITGESFDIKDNIMPNQYWDFSKSGRENAQRYLDYINDNGMTPKFSFLLSKDTNGDWVLPQDAVGDGYFKLLIDFKMYDNDGWGSPQNPVVPDFNMPYIQKMLEDYKGGHQAFPVAHDVVREFVEGKKNGKFSLSNEGEEFQRFGDYATPASDLRFEEDIAPVVKPVAENATTTEYAPVPTSVSEMETVEETVPDDYAPMPYDPGEEYAAMREEEFASISDADAPPAPNQPIKTVKERLTAKLQNLETELANNLRLREESKASYDEEIARLQAEYDARKNKNTISANNLLRRIERTKRLRDNVDADYAKRISDLEAKKEKSSEELRTGESPTEQGAMRRELHQSIVANIKSRFAEGGYDFDEVLKRAKNLATFSTVDNTPQRVMEKSLGYKEGQILSDLTVDQVARNESKGIRWLNSYTDRKNGILAQLSKEYGIKPGSKESAAAQMYAEGFYVNDNNEIIQYGDSELAQDFPDYNVRANIIGLSKDPRIRQIYDETLAMINASRAKNAYPEIKRLDNYFLHFRAMDDTFSRLGLPFNPNDIKAKDLPTDLNGVTADLKPGQPYFASAMHRKGKRTSFDLLGGLEKYLSSAKNQIYHIDDIQTLRALRNYIADTYGQASGLESLDLLTEEEAQERIKQVYDSHLSTFAKFLNEEANVIAGKTALIDRGLEGIIGRRGIQFLDTINRQVGSNMVGFNVSSSLTNFVSVAQAFAKTNKADFVKAFSQTAASKIGSMFGRTDSFAENNPTIIRRKGADRFYRTPWQKAGDAGYAMMSAVDNISTEIVVRAKYNELIRKGMSEQEATREADKWVSRLMGDRSLGQQPQLYNSKMLGILTKFQLEVRNQLDSQFYDTIQEAKVSAEDIENAQARNAKVAAKVGSTFFQLAVAQHLFGKAFESVAGYNPAFDIISVLVTALGFDDEEESEDTALDNIEQAFLELLGDLPYTSTFTGGRIPIESALPIEQFVTGKDQYGNEKSRWETLGEAAPYYLLPGGYGQIKKTTQGLDMFSDDHPVSGSYTDSGKLRFPVEDTFGNRLQAGLFGQYASGNARDYFDNERQALGDKQIQEFAEVGMTIQEYWKYRDGLKGLNSVEEKFDYISGLDIPMEKKNILINNLVDRKEDVDLTDYENYSSYSEFDFASKYPEKYSFLQENNISYEQYANADEDGRDAYNWAFNNPEKYTVSKAVSSDVTEYRKYTKDIYNLSADKDEDGKSISGSKKTKVIDYINNLDLDYGEKIILFKTQYPADNSYNRDIVEYLNSRNDITYSEIVTILRELEFTVLDDGTVQWEE